MPHEHAPVHAAATDEAACQAAPLTLHTYARAYAEAGMAVLAVEPGGKVPLTQRGKDSATSDPAAIDAWWTQVPDANIGLRPADGIVVLDVDPRAGGGTALSQLLAQEDRQLPPTRTADTGGAGLHIWYACPGPYNAKLCPGVDIKSHKGYVVAPPSLHASGRRYAWANDLPIASAPAWLQRLIRSQQRRRVGRPVPGHPVFAPLGGKAAAGLVRTVEQAAEGERNALLFWATCKAIESQAGPIVFDSLRDAARGVGLGDREIEQTMRSAQRRCEVAA